MMRTNSSKRSVQTNRLPDWYLGIDYVEINAREKSKQILLNHCRKKHTSAEMTLKIHHHQIGDGHALTVSVSWWEIWLFAMLLLILGIILDMRSKRLVG